MNTVNIICEYCKTIIKTIEISDEELAVDPMAVLRQPDGSYICWTCCLVCAKGGE